MMRSSFPRCLSANLTIHLCVGLLSVFVLPANAQTTADVPGSFDILFLGDTSFGENYSDRLASQGREPVLRTRGYDHMIEQFAGILAGADFTIANLETPVTDRFPSPFAGKKRYLHYSDVRKTPAMLARHGFDLVSLANNHAMDFGAKGLEQTIDLLHARRVRTCGAGAPSQAAEPFILDAGGETRGRRIAILCLFEYLKSYDEDYSFYADGSRAGVNRLSINHVEATIEALRKADPEVFIIAFPHWGRNYRWETDRQRKTADRLMKAGIDLIIGHGSHNLQRVESYQGRWIVYGLGNFVFGSPGRYAAQKAHPYSLIARLVLSGTAERPKTALRLYPILTDNRATGYQSRFVSSLEFQVVRQILLGDSSEKALAEAGISGGEDKHGLFLRFAVAGR